MALKRKYNPYDRHPKWQSIHGHIVFWFLTARVTLIQRNITNYPHGTPQDNLVPGVFLFLASHEDVLPAPFLPAWEAILLLAFW